jgi:drug/metabolite transporter (DMT)-like permease
MTAEPIIELALIVALMLFVYVGGLSSGRPLWTPGRGIAKDAASRVALFAILIVLFIGFLAVLLTGSPLPFRDGPAD